MDNRCKKKKRKRERGAWKSGNGHPQPMPEPVPVTSRGPILADRQGVNEGHRKMIAAAGFKGASAPQYFRMAVLQRPPAVRQ